MLSTTETTLDPRTYYVTLCQNIDENLTDKIIRYMAIHGYIGEENRVSREQLAIAMFGKATRNNDRKIRKAKENSAILSSSGKKGYYLAGCDQEVKNAIKENNNRIKSLQESNAALMRLDLPVKPKQSSNKPRQPLLWGGAL